MSFSHHRFLLVFISSCCIYYFSWLLQDSLFLNWDVGHLLNSAKLLLAGGSYSQDFFIPNTPVILHLYLPPILVSRYFQIDLLLSFRIYIYFLTTISLIFCYYFLHKQFQKQDKTLANLLFLVLVFSFLCLPLHEFGQRDHLLVVFAMPYLLLVSYQLRGNPSHFSYFFIGFWAAIGFAIKPQFLITPILIESYVMFYYRRWSALIRPELMAIVFFMIFYSIFTWLFYPDYISIVIPFLLKFYYVAVRSPWSEVLLNPLTIFFVLVLLFYIIENYYHIYNENIYKVFQNILLITLFSFVITYVSQHTTFYYHLIPAFTISLLLLMFLFYFLLIKSNNYPFSFILLSFLACTGYLFLIFPFKFLNLVYLFHPYYYFSFCAFIFLLVFGLSNKNIQIKLYVVLTIFFIFLYSKMAVKTDWQFNPFFATNLMLALSFIYLAVRFYSHPARLCMLGILSSVLFAFPCLMLLSIYGNTLFYKNEVLMNLTHFIKSQPNIRSIYTFSMYGNQVSPVAFYSHTNFAQRFDSLWMLHYMAQQIALYGSKQVKEAIRDNKEGYFFIKMLAEDLNRHKPDLVFVDDQPFNATFVTNVTEAEKLHLNLLAYFNSNFQFKEQWKSYKYLTTIENNNNLYPLKIIVYKRII